MKQTLYLYNLRNEKGRHIELLCLSQGIECRHVDSHEYGEYIGYIAQIPGFAAQGKPQAVPAFVDEMIVFKGFDQEMLGTFLAQYRQAGIEPVALKAGLTPTNVQWNSAQLHAELQQERAAFMQQQ